ncbi:MAG: ArnT family glycosyltransferase [Candidatus Velamenicoccus archaeovorus]
MNKKYLIAIIGAALLIKAFLLYFSIVHVPHARLVRDSYQYLDTGRAIVSEGVFASHGAGGKLEPNFFIAPGYPFFLGVLHWLWGIPLAGVIAIQVFLTVLAALITYKTAMEIDHRLGFLALAIFLYSPAVTMFSLLILTESLFLLLITSVMFCFIKYLKTGRMKFLVLTGLAFAAAVYVRPGPYFLGMVMAAFIAYANVTGNRKRAVGHAFVLLVVAYGLLGLWQIRNYLIFHKAVFSSIISMETVTGGAFGGLFHSYSRNQDPSTLGAPPLLYYINVSWRCALSLFTRPGTFKYLHCPLLAVIGKIFSYIVMVFWMGGFLYGVTKIRRNVYYQFLLLIVICFACGTIIVEMWNVGERYRVPMMPFIAIIAAYGWASLFSLKNGRGEFLKTKEL